MIKTPLPAVSVLSTFLLSSALISPAALATNQSNEHAYLGARLGWSHFQDACNADATQCQDDTLGAGVLAGYRFNHWLAIEGALTDYGNPDARYGDQTAAASLWGSELSARFDYGLTDSLAAYTRLGVSYLNMEKDTQHGTSQTHQSDIAWNPMLAVGMEWALSRELSLRAEYQYIDGAGSDLLGQSDLHYTSLGMSYHFGQQEAAAPVAAPVPVAMEAAPATREVTLSGDMTFADNSSELSHPDALAPLAAQLTRYDTGRIYITGHTDSRGSATYNDQLSAARAMAVSDYLVSKGISPHRITVKGMGERAPVADNRTPAGQAANRRVEVSFATTVLQDKKAM